MINILKFVVTISCIIWYQELNTLYACSDSYANWQAYYPSDIKGYFSPSPRYNIMVPDKSESIQRIINDDFMLEDQSTYTQGNGYKSVRTDISLENYFSERLDKGDPKFKTYLGNRNALPNRGPNDSNLRDLRLDDASPAGLVKTYYHLKMTGGLIFKTDQLKCDTNFEHAKTMHEHAQISGDDKYLNDHSEYINPDGELEYITSDTYCYFLYIPKAKDIGPFISRVHGNDVDSQFYIYKGSAPYLRLKSDIMAPKVASMDAGDLKFFEGRYLIPANQSKFLLPQNGLNILFNRVVIYRPYHHDRQKISTGSQLEWKVYNQLGAGMPPIKPNSQFWDEPVATGFDIPLQGVNMTGLLVDEYMAEHHQESSEGQKFSFGKPTGVSYMALDPENASPPDAPRIWPIAMHFPSATSEKQFFEKALNSGFGDSNQEINHNRTHKNALSKQEINNYLNRSSSDGVNRKRFQLLMKTNYLTEVEDSNVGIGAGSIEMPCDEATGQLKAYCIQFDPLRIQLENFFDNNIVKTKPSPPYNDYDWTDDDGSAADLKVLLSTNTSVVATTVAGITNRDYKVQQKLPAIVAILSSGLNADFTDLAVGTGIGGTANADFNKFQFQSDVGRKIQAMRTKLQLAMKADDKRYSDDYFIGEVTGETEDAYFLQSLVSVSGSTEMTTRLQALFSEAPNLALRYSSLETDRYYSGSFLYYTTNESSGRRLLSRLAIMQNLVQAASLLPNVDSSSLPSLAEVNWEYFKSNVSGTCDLNLGSSESDVNQCLDTLVNRNIPEANPVGKTHTGDEITRY